LDALDSMKADMEDREGIRSVQNDPTGAAKVDARTRRERLRTRAARVRYLLEREVVDRAVNALGRVHEPRPDLVEVVLRPSFLIRAEPAAGELSDRKPPREGVPPSIQVLAPNGIAQQVELLSLFDAQHQARPGAVVRLARPIVAASSGEVGFRDLVVPQVTARGTRPDPGRVNAVNLSVRRDVQLKAALRRLEARELVDLSAGRSSRRGRYEGFQLLDEGGRRPHGDPLRYRVPKPSDSPVAIPVDFFLKGWIYLLTEAEIAMWLVLRHLRHTSPIAHDTNGVSVSGQDRLAWYGLRKEAYGSYAMLARMGLVRVHVAEARRPDGTFEDYGSDGRPALHRFQLLDDCLARPAVEMVPAALARALRDPSASSVWSADQIAAR
jgi:hypothetical protein